MKQTILITGCSTGIGLQTAIYLHNEGYRVFATARKQEDIATLQELGIETFYLDVQKPATIDKLFEDISKLTNRLDVVFNNAGYGQPGAIEDLGIEALKQQFETNVFGVHRVTLYALKKMKQQGYGKIIQHSSVLGLVSLKFRGAYNASKYALEGLTDTLRLELKDTNIQVTTLNTGPIISNFRSNAKRKLIENIDIDNSRFKELYKKSLSLEKSNVPFTLNAIDVAIVVHKIIKSKKIKPRYYITKATYLLSFAKRILPTKYLDIYHAK
jgi:NAD(P)-dependent dehydrogenase (short-subunit alcohol dehydrogenase family)